MDRGSEKSVNHGPGNGQGALHSLRLRGGVSVGLVDYGFDLLHPSLLWRVPMNGEHPASGLSISRFAAVFDQNTGELLLRDGTGGCEPRTADGNPLGYSLDRLIDDAVKTGDRTVLDRIYDPHKNYYDETAGRNGAHGTMMASIVSRESGRDPSIDLLALQLALPEAGWREIDGDGRPSWCDWNPVSTPLWLGWRTYLEQSAFVDAIDWIYEAACRRGDDAVIINLSLGTWAGPHNGRSRVELKIAEVLARAEVGDGPVAAVVVPMGNAGADRGHASGVVGAGAPWTVTWVFECASDERVGHGPQKLEIWYEADCALMAHIGIGYGAAPIVVGLGATTDLRVAETRVGVADHRVAVDGGRMNAVRVSCRLTEAGSRSKSLTITLAMGGDGPAVPVHAWVERSGDGVARSWLSPFDLTSTLGGLATAPGAIAVGALDTTGVGPARAFEASGRGPHPWMPEAYGALPHVWAPGHRIRAARSKRADETTTSGTSVACAAVSGRLAARFVAIRETALSCGADVRRALQAELAKVTRLPDRGRDLTIATAADTLFQSTPHLETLLP